MRSSSESTCLFLYPYFSKFQVMHWGLWSILNCFYRVRKRLLWFIVVVVFLWISCFPCAICWRGCPLYNVMGIFVKNQTMTGFISGSSMLLHWYLCLVWNTTVQFLITCLCSSILLWMLCVCVCSSMWVLWCLFLFLAMLLEFW